MPNQRGDEGAYECSGNFYMGVGRELVCDVKHHP
jgi:hypothetical protein